MRNFISRWGVILLLLALAAPSQAQVTPTDPKEMLRRANALYNLGRFAEAAKQYEELFVLRSDQTVLLYNIGQSYRQAGDTEKAVFFYRRYLSTTPDARNREDVEARIAALERVMAEQKKAQAMPPQDVEPVDTKPGKKAVATAPAGKRAPKAEPKPEPKPPATTPTTTTPTTTAATAEPKPETSPAAATTGPAAPKTEARTDLTAQQPAPEPKTASTPVYKKWWLWTIVGGVVLVGAGVGAGVAVASSPPSFNPTFGEFSKTLWSF